MNVRSILVTTLTLFSATFSFSQAKDVSHLEIDRLARKYKTVHSIILYTPDARFNTTVSIDYNTDGKPYAINFEGVDTCHTDNCLLQDHYYGTLPEISELFDILEKQKESKGYHYNQNLSKPDADVYSKGNIFTRFSIVDISELGQFALKIQKFIIRTEDFSRSGGKKATNFDF